MEWWWIRLAMRSVSEFNPWTNQPVDVRGIPPKTLVMDPQDPEREHRFRVPDFPESDGKSEGEGTGTDVPVDKIPDS